MSSIKCINCNFEFNSNKVTLKITDIDSNLEIPLLLSKLLSGNDNDIEVTDKSHVVSRVLFSRFCDACSFTLKQLILSRQKFLKSTNSNSEIRKIIATKNKFASSQECILPDNESIFDDGNATLQVQTNQNQLNQSDILNSTPPTQFKELFIQLKILKLDESTLKLTKKSIITKNQCNVCFRNFPDSKECENHLNNTHLLNKARYSCPHCSKKFSLQWFLAQHIKVLHNGVEILYSCQLCKERFYSEADLEKHNLIKHDIRKYSLKCNRCKKSFPNISLLRQHLIETHPGTWEAVAAGVNKQESAKENQKQCFICETLFDNSFKLAKHMDSKHSGTKFVCRFCSTPQSSYNNLWAHEKGHKTVDCKQCGNIFPSILNLNLHEKYAHKCVSNKCICEICGQNYQNFYRLKCHYLWHYNKSHPRRYPCYICRDKGFSNKSSLMTHIKMVHWAVKKKLTCTNCEKIFAHKWELNQHMEQIHTKKPSFPCKTCGKKFMELRSVSAHSRLHTLASGRNWTDKLQKLSKPSSPETTRIEVMSCFSAEMARFICPVCQKPSGWKNHFIRHLRCTHSLVGYTNPDFKLEIPAKIKCLQCDKLFARKDLMLRHARRYHPDTSTQYTGSAHSKDSLCTICNEKVLRGRREHMRSHIRRHFVYVETVAESKGKGKNLNHFYSEISHVLKCPFCGMCTRRQPQFILHMRNEHKCSILIDKDEKRLYHEKENARKRGRHPKVVN